MYFCKDESKRMRGLHCVVVIYPGKFNLRPFTQPSIPNQGGFDWPLQPLPWWSPLYSDGSTEPVLSLLPYQYDCSSQIVRWRARCRTPITTSRWLSKCSQPAPSNIAYRSLSLVNTSSEWSQWPICWVGQDPRTTRARHTFRHTLLASVVPFLIPGEHDPCWSSPIYNISCQTPVLLPLLVKLSITLTNQSAKFYLQHHPISIR